MGQLTSGHVPLSNAPQIPLLISCRVRRCFHFTNQVDPIKKNDPAAYGGDGNPEVFSVGGFRLILPGISPRLRRTTSSAGTPSRTFSSASSLSDPTHLCSIYPTRYRNPGMSHVRRRNPGLMRQMQRCLAEEQHHQLLWSSDPDTAPPRPGNCPSETFGEAVVKAFDENRCDSEDARIAFSASRVEGHC